MGIENISNQELENSISDTNTIIEEQNPDYDIRVDKLISFMENKKYKIYRSKNILNILSMRGKDSGEITNRFDEKMFVFYMDDSNNWKLNEYDITTLPGLIISNEERRLPNNVNLLSCGQYIDQCSLNYYKGDLTHRCLSFNNSTVYINKRTDRYDYSSPTKTGNFGISIHRSSSSGTSELVYDYSQNGDQVFKNYNQFNQFIKLCEKQELIKNNFTYTICLKSDFDRFLI